MTTPVATLSVYTPTPATVTTPSASHASGFEAGVIKHVAAVFKPATAVANPFAPLIVVNATVPPAITAFVSGVAAGGAGSETVGVILAPASWPVESVTAYFTGAAVPLNVGNGSNVTVPLAFTVYVPSPATVKVGNVQLLFAVAVVAHNFTDVATNVTGETTVSFVKTEIT